MSLSNDQVTPSKHRMLALTLIFFNLGGINFYNINEKQFIMSDLNQKTKIISAFPGVGKTYLGKHSDSSIVDFCSGMFSKDKNGDLHPDFPNNYVQAMLNVMGKCDIILISCHTAVTDTLENEGIEYTLVYPDIVLKDEYIKRYEQRGNPKKWIDNVAENWNDWIAEMENQAKCTKIRLSRGQYLSDVLP